MTSQVTPYPDPYLKPPPRLPDLKECRGNLADLDMENDIKTDFEENSPYQEGIIQRLLKDWMSPMLKRHQNLVIYLTQVN